MAEDPNPLNDGVTAGGEQIATLEDAADRSAEAIGAAFRAAGLEIESALAAAAQSGELSFQSMAQAIARQASSIGVERFIRAPLGDLIGGFTDAIFGRAGGGPVMPGGTYLVGETGPEIFRPASAGNIEPAGQRPVVVNVTVAGGDRGGELHRTEAQVAAAVGRAAAQAMRRL